MSRWKGQHFHSLFQAKARGVFILISQNVPFEAHAVTPDKSGRCVMVRGKLYNTMVALVNIYAPNTDDGNLFKQLFSLLPDLNKYSLILGGDFNCWLDLALDRSSSKNSTISESTLVIQAFLSDYGICDVWRTLYPKTRDYSFFSHVHCTFSRIDYFIIDRRCMPRVHSCAYQSTIISDHTPLPLTMSSPDLPQKSTQWRFNSGLL